MKELLVLALGMVFLLGAGGRHQAQPEATGYTLSDIYYYLIEGIVAVDGDHSLDPPTGSVPGDSRFLTIRQIYEGMQDLFEQCDAQPDQVLETAVFFSSDSDNWGPQAGTKSEIPDRFISSEERTGQGTHSIPEGTGRIICTVQVKGSNNWIQGEVYLDRHKTTGTFRATSGISASYVVGCSFSVDFAQNEITATKVDGSGNSPCTIIAINYYYYKW